MSFERLCAEIEQIRENYGHVLKEVYTKRKSSFPCRRYNVVWCIRSLANHYALLYNNLTWPADSVHCFDSAQSLSNSRRGASLGNVTVYAHAPVCTCYTLLAYIQPLHSVLVSFWIPLILDLQKQSVLLTPMRSGSNATRNN